MLHDWPAYENYFEQLDKEVGHLECTYNSTFVIGLFVRFLEYFIW